MSILGQETFLLTAANAEVTNIPKTSCSSTYIVEVMFVFFAPILISTIEYHEQPGWALGGIHLFI